MSVLLAFSRAVDAVNAAFGRFAEWMVLAACLVSAFNAMRRYGFTGGSNAWLEIQWYMFSAIFLLGAAYTLKLNEHVRVDIVYANVSERARLWIDVFGLIFFLLPATAIIAYMAWPFFLDAFMRNETSSNEGGLIRWPVKLLLPLGFALLTLQGLSELIKRIAALRGLITVRTTYEKPLQ